MQKPLKTRVNSKYQSKGSTYILHLLAFVEIRLFNVFLWERKAGFGKLMKNVRVAGFSRKRGGNAGSGPPLPDPHRKDSQSQGTRLHLSFPCPDFSYGDGNHTKRAKKTFDQLGCDSRVGQ